MSSIRLGLIACILLVPIDVSAQPAMVYVHTGPDQGEVQVTAPWGNYVVYDEGGGEFWVGTQRNYDRQRAIGIFQEHGARLSSVNVGGADATFVPDASYRTQVGDISIDDVAPEVMFRVDPKNPPRPHIPSTSNYVGLSWIQSSPHVPQTLLYDVGAVETYRPYWAASVGNSQYASEFAVPRKRITRPMLILFIIPGQKPGAVGIPSLTSATYASDIEEVKEDRSEGIASNPDTLQEIIDLQRIDPLLAPHASKVPAQRATVAIGTPVPSSTPSPAPTAQQVALVNQAWSGEIKDVRAGKGKLTLTFAYDSGGSFVATFASDMSNFGRIIDVQSTSSGYAFVMKSDRQPGCDYNVTALIATDGTLQGSYLGCGCNTGTFALRRATP